MAIEKPPWLKVKLPGGDRYRAIQARARGLRLHTVCEEARCPNMGECWGEGTATFMVMGSTCTRGCRFCAVDTRRTGDPLDPDEPRKVAAAVAAMGLDYVVLTSVNRDDLADHGAAHVAACVGAVREAAPGTQVEVLIPDFGGARERVAAVIAAGPRVLAHNVECTEALTSLVRDPRAGYQQSLDVLAAAADLGATTKSSIMVGLGEPEMDVAATLRDLREVGCAMLTIGQYLRPSKRHLPVVEYVTPERFDRYRDLALELGFSWVASGPLVRSSYRAGELFLTRALRGRTEPQPPDAGEARAGAHP